jgi:hypothetical protein
VESLLPQTIFNENIKKLETIYTTLLKGETNPGIEAELRVEIIDIISNLEAAVIGAKNSNKEFITLLTKVREEILSWDPHGLWFRNQKGLVDSIVEIITKSKSVVLTPEENNSETTRLKKELASMKSELSDLKSLINSLMEEKAALNQTSVSAPSEISESTSKDIPPPPPQEEEEIEKPKSQLPWKRNAEIKTSAEPQQTGIKTVEEEPPIILPITSEEEPKEEIFEPKEAIEEPIIGASATMHKLTKVHTPDENPATIINKMKSIISEAEEETRKEISALKETIKESSQTPQSSPPLAEENIEMPTISPPAIEAPVVDDIHPKKPITEEETPIIPPTEPKTEDVPEEPDADPYMQLLTLEAEKYRLEKEIEKNETDFQEGLKSRQEFDENINLINEDLVKVRQQIDLLRKQLVV